MGWEWLPVAGTLGGAVIGGGVSLLKGWQDGRAEERRAQREDRHRAEDREWAVRDHDRDLRGSIYLELSRMADKINEYLSLLYHDAESGSEDGPLYTEAGRQVTQDALREFEAAVERARFVSVDPSVVDAARTFYARSAWMFMSMPDPDDTTASTEELLALVRLAGRMKDLCRADLELINPPRGGTD